MSTTHTIRLHRVLRAPPERVYQAFLDADAMAKWLPPNGFTGKVHHIDAKVGGRLQDVVHEFHHRQEPLLRRQISRTGAARTHSLHGQVRRPESAGRNAGDGDIEKGVVRHGVEHRARRRPRRSFPPKRATSAGRNRSPCSPNSSKPKFQTSSETVTPDVRRGLTL